MNIFLPVQGEKGKRVYFFFNSWGLAFALYVSIVKKGVGSQLEIEVRHERSDVLSQGQRLVNKIRIHVKEP